MPPNDDMLELTQDELDAMISERAEEQVTRALELAREQDRERFEQLEAQAREDRIEAHRGRVDSRIREMQDAGHAPAVLTAAKAIMLADEGADVLALDQTDEDGAIREVKLSASDIVEMLLAAIPETGRSLVRNQPRLGKGSTNGSATGDDLDPKERAKQLLEDARSGASSDML